MLGRLEFHLELVEDIHFDQRVGDQRRLLRILAADRDLEHHGLRQVPNGQLVQQRVDRTVPRALCLVDRPGRRGAARRRVQAGKIAQKRTNPRFQPGGECGVAQSPVEFGVTGQVQPVHNLAQQRPALENFDLGIDGRGIPGQPADDTFQVNNALLSGFEDDDGSRTVDRRCHDEGIIGTDNHRDEHGRCNDPAPPPEKRDQCSDVGFVFPVVVLGHVGHDGFGLGW